MTGLKQSRRSFLKISSTLAAIDSVLGTRRRVFPTEPNLQFPTEPHARLAVASWPFREFIESPTNKWARNPKKPGMDLMEFGTMVVKRFGLHNIEPLGSHFRSTDPAYSRELGEATEKAGARIVDIPVDLRDSFYDPDGDKRRKSIESSKKWIDIAVAAGSPSVRLHIAGVHNVKPDVTRAAESLKQVATQPSEASR